jgi:hypothetical protein
MHDTPAVYQDETFFILAGKYAKAVIPPAGRKTAITFLFSTIW